MTASTMITGHVIYSPNILSHFLSNCCERSIERITVFGGRQNIVASSSGSLCIFRRMHHQTSRQPGLALEERTEDGEKEEAKPREETETGWVFLSWKWTMRELNGLYLVPTCTAQLVFIVVRKTSKTSNAWDWISVGMFCTSINYIVNLA